MVKPGVLCTTDPPDFFPSFPPQESGDQATLIPQNTQKAPAQPHFLPQRPPPSSTSHLLERQAPLQLPVSQNDRTAPAGRDLKRSSGPSFCGKRHLDEIISQHVKWHLEHLQPWGLRYVPGEAVPVYVLTVKSIFLILKRNLSVQHVPVAPCHLLVMTETPSSL